MLKAFVIAQHPLNGFLMLKSAKKGKGLQLPGGRANPGETDPGAVAARELWEETGVDLRASLHRLVALRPLLAAAGQDVQRLGNRHFFLLDLSDADSVPVTTPTPPEEAVGGAYYRDAEGFNPHIDADVLTWNHPTREFVYFGCRLSAEHSHFDFAPDVASLSAKVSKHSKGKCSEALNAAVAAGLL